MNRVRQYGGLETFSLEARQRFLQQGGTDELFNKEKEKLVLEGGYLQDRLIGKKDIETMSKLPSKDVLRAQVVCTLNAPIQGFVLVLNQTLKKFVYCLDQIKQKKPQS